MTAADHAGFYAEHGYLAVPDLIRPDELSELRSDLVRLARGAYPCPSLEPLPSDVTDSEALQRILWQGARLPVLLGPVP